MLLVFVQPFLFSVTNLLILTLEFLDLSEVLLNLSLSLLSGQWDLLSLGMNWLSSIALIVGVMLDSWSGGLVSGRFVGLTLRARQASFILIVLLCLHRAMIFVSVRLIEVLRLLVVLGHVVLAAVAIVVSPIILRLPLLNLVTVFGSLWVHCEVLRIFFVAEGAPLVPLELMRLNSELHVRLFSLVGVLADPLLVRRRDRGKTSLTMGPFVSVSIRWGKSILDLLTRTVVLVFFLVP